MLRLDVWWTWRTVSPLHCGSGLAQPGYADRLVQIDAGGRPVLVGDAVKGALRMAAEQVLAWLKAPRACDARYHDPNHTGSAEPEHPLLIALFGGAGHQHYAPGVLVEDVGRSVIASTAIDRDSGSALDNTLRYVEHVPVGARFRCGCTIWLANDHLLEPAVTLLLAALTAAESIGAKAGIGWGRVAIEDLRAKRGDGTGDAVPVDPTAALAAGRLEQLARGEHRDPRPPDEEHVAADPSPTGGPLQWWRLHLHLAEPTCVGSRPDVSNKVATLDSLPASTLRGALRTAWLRMGVSEAHILPRLGTHTRWTPAGPALTSPGGDLVPCVPIPLSFSREKDAGNNRAQHIHDALSGSPPPEQGDDGRHLQWRPLGDGWMAVHANSEPAAPPRLQFVDRRAGRETRMHVARDYFTGSKRSSALFARESLLPADGRGFVAYVGLPSGLDPCWPEELFVGKRRSAGNGRARLEAHRLDDVDRPWPPAWFGCARPLPRGEGPLVDPADRATDVFIQLLTPAIVRGDDGYTLRTVKQAAWERLLWPAPQQPPRDWTAAGGSVQRTAASLAPAWMSTWRHGRAAVTCIAPGSVWRLRCRDPQVAEQVRTRLRSLAANGLGERCHEGFGWLVVDPPWLGDWRVAVSPADAPGERIAGQRRTWPGCDGVDSTALLDIVERARGMAARDLPHEVRGPLQELANQVRGEGTPAIRQALQLCERMATRRGETNRWRWLHSGSPPRCLLDDVAQDPRLFAFALEALLIRTTPLTEATE